MWRKAIRIDVKKNTILLHYMGISHHEISRRLKISRHRIRQPVRKFDKLHTVAMTLGGGRPQKATDRDQRLIKLQQLRDDTNFLADLVRYAHTNLNLFLSRSTISRILREFDMVSYIAPWKPKITRAQRSNRVHWYHQHSDWSMKQWSRVIFSDESNFEIVNRKS